jgi:transcriptional regulator with XRE-family HTH domain
MNAEPRQFDHFQLGGLLKSWRVRAGRNQLDVALSVGVSTRHLSYIECGRAQPSETLLMALLRELDVPRPERNALFLAAGFRPRQEPAERGSPPQRQTVRILERYLGESGPNPVLVKDAIWDVIGANEAARALFSALLGSGLDSRQPMNVLEWVFLPNRLRPRIRNWDEVADSLIRHVRHEVGFAADHIAFRDVIATVANTPGFQERWDATRAGDRCGDTTVYRFELDGAVLSFEAVLMSLGSPYEASLKGIRLDSFLPLDEQTRCRMAAMMRRSEPAADPG